VPQTGLYEQECAARQTLEIVSDKWAVLVLTAIDDDVRHHGELGRQVSGITKKMLTQTLRNLERDGLISRQSCFVNRVRRVEYRLTDVGISIRSLVNALCDWSQQHFHQVQAARAKFDANTTNRVLTSELPRGALEAIILAKLDAQERTVSNA
jgi:DNA-binding HxlR family transcriptional regulator